jgi:hypothetical protein
MKKNKRRRTRNKKRPIKALPNYRELSRADPAPLKVPLLPLLILLLFFLSQYCSSPTSRCLFSLPILFFMFTAGAASFQISPPFPHCCYCRSILDLPSPSSLPLPLPF